MCLKLLLECVPEFSCVECSTSTWSTKVSIRAQATLSQNSSCHTKLNKCTAQTQLGVGERGFSISLANLSHFLSSGVDGSPGGGSSTVQYSGISSFERSPELIPITISVHRGRCHGCHGMERSLD